MLPLRLCWSCRPLWTKKIQHRRETLRILILSKHCSLQSQKAELQKQAFRLLQRRRWSYHTLLARNTWRHRRRASRQSAPRGKSSKCFMVGSSMTCGTGTSTHCSVRHIKEDGNLLTAFQTAANSTPISSSVLVTRGFTSASTSRCRKRHRPLRCHGHCEAWPCQHHLRPLQKRTTNKLEREWL